MDSHQSYNFSCNDTSGFNFMNFLFTTVCIFYTSVLVFLFVLLIIIHIFKQNCHVENVKNALWIGFLWPILCCQKCCQKCCYFNIQLYLNCLRKLYFLMIWLSKFILNQSIKLFHGDKKYLKNCK